MKPVCLAVGDDVDMTYNGLQMTVQRKASYINKPWQAEVASEG
jgi:hypothetical protein